MSHMLAKMKHRKHEPVTFSIINRHIDILNKHLFLIQYENFNE